MLPLRLVVRCMQDLSHDSLEMGPPLHGALYAISSARAYEPCASESCRSECVASLLPKYSGNGASGSNHCAVAVDSGQAYPANAGGRQAPYVILRLCNGRWWCALPKSERSEAVTLQPPNHRRHRLKGAYRAYQEFCSVDRSTRLSPFVGLIERM
jgi:hypothetical protein